MISRIDINDRVREWGLREEIVEKDYVIGWILWGIGNDRLLKRTWCFKGGTSIKKCYIETYRFSEDLDFTVMPGGPIEPTELNSIFEKILNRVYEASGIDFSARSLRFRKIRDLVTEGRIYYRGLRNAPGVSRIKLDLSAEEIVARPTVLRDIVHPYPDVFPSSGKIRCYSFEEVFAEKIRALGERYRPRDLYDVINLFRREDLHAEPSLIQEVLIRKCKSKGVELPTFDALESSPSRPELESEWENMLAHQIRILPPIKEFWDALPHLFGWLGGTISKESLPPIPLKEGTWVPSPTEWQRSNKRSLLEPIRFAAVNHLCVKLGYGNKFRLVEPYSLRTSKPGNLLFYAWKIPSQAIRSYRVDHIQSVEVTTQAFRPKFAIEFPSTGRLVAPPSVRRVKRRR